MKTGMLSYKRCVLPGCVDSEGDDSLYIDIHNHCLPNVDDGSGSIEESLDMLRICQKNHFDEIIVTPHFHYLRGKTEAQEILDGTNRLQKAAEQAGLWIRVHAGNEIYYSHDVPELLTKGEILTLAGSRYVLVEFSPMEWAKNVRDGLYEVMSAGFYPVLAHAERVLSIAEDLRELDALVDQGVYIQVNVKSAKTQAGFKLRRFVLEAARQGMIHFLATDAHGSERRTPDISTDLRYIQKKLGTEFLHRVMCENPGKIIKNETI